MKITMAKRVKTRQWLLPAFRVPRYSLRKLMFAVVAVAVPLGCVVQFLEFKTKRVEELARLEAALAPHSLETAEYLFGRPGLYSKQLDWLIVPDVYSVGFEGKLPSMQLDIFSQIRRSVHRVGFADFESVDSNVLRQVAGPRTEAIAVVACRMEENFFEAIEDTSTIKEVYLRGNGPIRPDALHSLTKMSNLEDLHFEVHANALLEVDEFSTHVLRRLHLTVLPTECDSLDCEDVRALPPPLTSKHLKFFAHLGSLESLDITGLLDESAVATIVAHASRLRSVKIREAIVSSKMAASLASLKNLADLQLDRCHVTEDAMSVFDRLSADVSIQLQPLDAFDVTGL